MDLKDKTKEQLIKEFQELKTKMMNCDAVFESSPVAMLVVDETTNIVMVNLAAVKLCGGSDSDILEHRPGNALRCVHSTKDPRGCGYSPDCKTCAVRNGIESIIAKGGSINGAELEFTLNRDKAPKKVWMNVGVEPLIKDGRKHWCIAMNDITQSKLAEEALNNSLKNEQFLAEIVRDTSVAIAIGYPDGTIGITNNAFQELTGYTEKELKQIDWNRKLTPKKWIEIEAQKLQELNETKKSIIYQKEVIRKDGTVIPVEPIVQATFNEKGEVEYYKVFVTDITEKKNAEQELINAKENAEEGEEKVTRIIESTIDFIWTVDPVNFGIQTYNSALYNYFLNDAGIKMKIGDTPDVLVSSRAEDWKNYYRKALEFGTFEIEYEVVANENILHLSLNTLTRNNKVFGISVFGRDITRLKKNELELIKAKEKAEESNRLKTAFMNNISHEIRTPLNGILGFAPLAIQSDISDEEKQKFLKILNISSDRLMNTITDYMDMSLIVSGGMPVNKKEVDIEALLNTLYFKFDKPFNEKNLQLKLQNPTNRVDFVLITDEELLKKSISHLLYNALKFTKEGTITFGYEIKSNNLEIFVKDTGIGIAPDAKERILQVFMQENVLNTRGHEGSGLGLSIANGLTKLLGGKLRIESEILKGTSVFISLPIEPNTTILDNKLATNKNALKETAKILIAEDDDVGYLYLETILKNVSAKIMRAVDGKQAIEICKKNSDIDLVLMDIQLPVLNGHEVTRQIRQFNKDVVIIAQTAYGLSGDREKAMEAGCNDYISKPIKKEKLFSLVKNYFKR